MKNQKISNQKGEITFRKKLYQKQVEQQDILGEEYDADGISQVLKDRMYVTYEQMRALKDEGVILSPYIEIGAERGQRSLCMENDLDAHGASVDISYDMLKSSMHYMQEFKKEKAPVKVCCDAYNLPFQSGSVPFVFCYETLHHFPEPAPIINEAYRVLAAGGYFFFAEEPYKKVLHVPLYKKKTVWGQKKASALQRILDFFFCEYVHNEVEYGIIENEDISIKTWTKAMSVFDQVKLDLKTIRNIRTTLQNPASYFSFLIASLMGGEISGICKKGGMRECVDQGIEQMLICPTCRMANKETVLILNNDHALCPDCNLTYPIQDNILFLFVYEKLQELYPEIFKTVAG